CRPRIGGTFTFHAMRWQTGQFSAPIRGRIGWCPATGIRFRLRTTKASLKQPEWRRPVMLFRGHERRRAVMQVGYLGVGNMGQPMAGKLMDGGHSLVVFDVSEAAMEPLLLRQAKRAASPRDLGDQCEIVAVSLPTLTAFRAAVLGPEGLVAGRAIKVLLNTCTVGVPFLREIEAAFAPKGIAIIDCPISG